MWDPNVNIAKKFELLQKRAVKWILGEIGKNKMIRNTTENCKLDFLPIHYFFIVKKFKLFCKIVNETSSIKMHAYLIRKENSRTIDNRLNYAISSDVKQPIVRRFSSS